MKILSKVAHNGVISGDWYQVETNKTHVACAFSLLAGTGTVVIEGRISAEDTPVVLNTLSASDGFMVAAFPQMRARLSAAAAATVEVAMDGSLTKVL